MATESKPSDLSEQAMALAEQLVPPEDIPGGIEPGGELPNGLLVRREEEPLLAAEVEEHRPLGDADLRGDVLDPGTAVALVGEMAHGDLDDLVAPGAGPGAFGGHRVRTLAEKKNPRDLRLAGGRSLQPPSAPRAQVLRATSHSRLGFRAVNPFVGLWGLPSLPARTAS